MAKSKHRKPEPTFEVVLSRYPEHIPLGKAIDCLAAIKSLIGGEAEDSEPATVAFTLLDIKRSSTKYRCVASNPDDAMERILSLARFTSNNLGENEDLSKFGYALNPIKNLSSLAQWAGGPIKIRVDKKDVISFAPDTFEVISRDLLIKGNTTFTGEVTRVGGATAMKCAIRIPGRRTLLHCEIATDEIAKTLGKHLYENVNVSGEATWFHGVWTILNFKIQSVKILSRGGIKEKLKEVFEAGASEWNNVDDPVSLLKEMRS